MNIQKIKNESILLLEILVPLGVFFLYSYFTMEQDIIKCLLNRATNVLYLFAMIYFLDSKNIINCFNEDHEKRFIIFVVLFQVIFIATCYTLFFKENLPQAKRKGRMPLYIIDKMVVPLVCDVAIFCTIIILTNQSGCENYFLDMGNNSLHKCFLLFGPLLFTYGLTSLYYPNVQIFRKKEYPQV